MRIKASELNTLERCGERFRNDKLGVVSIKGRAYHLSIAIKETIKHLLLLSDADFQFFFNKTYIKEYLDEILDDNLFNPLSKEEYLKETALQIERYINFIKSSKMELIRTNLLGDVEINQKTITITADFAFKDVNNVIEIVKIKRGEPKLSYAARVFDNKPENNLELYLLEVLGEKLYPKNKVIGSFHHMASKGDKKDDFILDYDSKKGYNIISFLESKRLKEEDKRESKRNLKARVESLIKESEGNVFEKTSDKKECNFCTYNNVCNYKKAQEVDLEKIEEVSKAPESFDLTEAQRSAIIQEEGIFRVNAGAGSGKTTVVALRVAELILAGYKPENILLVTFTNKGAVEMREKISYWLNVEGISGDARRLNITTFNSWGDRVIKENHKILGFSSPPNLIEKVEKYDILFKLLKKEDRLEGYDYKNPLMNFRYAKGVIVKIEELFNFIDTNNIQNPLNLPNEDDTKETERRNIKIFNIYKEYKKILRERNLIEYQDQMRLITVLMEEYPDELDKYNYEHIIVDEYQDTDIVQLDIIMFLSGHEDFKSLMVVGDDSQSIFGFRNTSQKFILEFDKYFSNVKDINMVDNFRSTPQIIELANAINDLNENKVDKELVSGLEDGNKPELVISKSADDEYEFISDKIKELLETNLPEDIAVITRTKSEIFQIEEYLKEKEIPYIIDVPEPLLNNTNIHIANSFIDFLADTKVTQGLFEYLSAVTNEFDGMTHGEIKDLIELEHLKIKHALDLTTIIGCDEEERYSTFFNRLKEIEDDVFQEFLEDLKKKNLPFPALRAYLNKFIEYEDEKTLEKNNNKYRAVTLTTAHTSKGKEFEIVFNTISKYRADNNLKAIEEERRTLFVSLTRAKKELFITYTKPKANKRKVGKTQHSFDKELINTHKCIIREVGK